MNGFAHGYYSGDPLKLFDDIQTLKPTFLATVPRILNRVHGKIIESANSASGFKKMMFNNAVNTKTTNLLTKGVF